MLNSQRDLVIQHGRVLDPSQGMDREADVLVRDGRIAAIGENLAADGAERLDAAGCLVAPGFIDLHCHLREPGKEYAETIESGGRAAATAGVTSVLFMPATRPAQ